MHQKILKENVKFDIKYFSIVSQANMDESECLINQHLYFFFFFLSFFFFLMQSRFCFRVEVTRCPGTDDNFAVLGKLLTKCDKLHLLLFLK